MQSLSQSPLDPAFIQNPYPFYDRARACGPLFFWPEYDLACACSFEAVDSLLRDRRLGRAQPVELQRPVPEHLQPFYAFERHSMLELEPPDHTRLRGLVLRAFTSRRINAMADQIAALGNRLIDAFPVRTSFDLLPAFAEQIPVIVISRLLGVPEEMAPQLLGWSHDMVAMYQANRDRQTEERAVVATCAFSDFMRDYIDSRRSRPADDLISTLIAANADGARLSTDELITTTILLLNAGHEATVHAIGNGVKTLLQSGQDIAALLAPERCAATIEETIRLDPPLHMFTRYVYEDMTIFGEEFKRGAQIGLLLGAANHDPRRFPSPQLLDPARKDGSNASFGAGLHFCIGAPLARLELQIALPILFGRCPTLTLARPPDYADRYHFHGLTQLMVRL